MKDLKNNYTLLCDFYELTMGNGYFKCGYGDRIVYFDMFFRKNPDEGGYAIAAGLEQVVEYIKDLHFTEEDIEFLRGKGCFDEAFLAYLRDFRFTGDIWAVPEGTVVFPNEPLVVVRSRAIEAQFIETYVLMQINHQSLIATKASRLARAAKGRAISEFGSRRAHGPDAAILGARAAYVGGCKATACTLTDEVYGVPATGTMAHSWVQMFDSEYEAFKAYCEVYPTSATLLVDTFNVLKSGVPNAIKVFDEVLKPKGCRPVGIRLDSGDITYLSIEARRMLDEAGYPDCKIVASNSLDEHLIKDMLSQGAKVDLYGVGERLITSKSSAVFDGVYKLVAVENDEGEIIPKIKISENVQKITNPHFKKLYRFYDNTTYKAIADLMTVHDEVIDENKPIELFDPVYTWKRQTLTNYTCRQLLVPIFKNGELVYNLPTLQEIRDHCVREVNTMWESVTRFENPHAYYVDLSQKLWDIKHELLDKGSKR